MHGFDVHEAFYKNREIYGLLIRGSVSGVGPIWPYSKLNLDYSQACVRKTKGRGLGHKGGTNMAF